ncbi:MAG: glycosyltransferase family 4 protein [Actinomycetota bacterium]
MISPLRLLICTPRFAPQVGGAETWTREIAAGLAARGHEVHVIARAAPGCESDVAGPVSVHRVHGGRAAFTREVARAVLRMRPDVVLAQYSALPPAVAAARRAHVPSLGIVHDVYGAAERIRVNGVAGGLARLVALERAPAVLAPDGFLVPSAATGRGLARIARGRPVVVVPAGADHVAACRSPVRDFARVVFVGRLVPQKGVEDLLRAMRIVRARRPDAHLTVIGDGPDGPRLRALAADLGTTVEFVGRVQDAVLDALVRGAGVLALPSTREGWGLAVTEAAARGVAYVAYDVPAVREQHAQLRGGVLVEPDARALAGVLLELLDDPAATAALGERGRIAAAGRKWADAAEIVEGSIAAVAAGRRRAS